MKSVEEFATEYAQDKYLPVQTFQAVKAGANYVLDEIIDCLLKHPHLILMRLLILLRVKSNN